MIISLRVSRSTAVRFLSSVSGPPGDRGINDSKAGVVEATANVAEAKMQRWLSEGGADNLTGPAYKHDRHKDAATALGVGDNYKVRTLKELVAILPTPPPFLNSSLRSSTAAACTSR